MNEEKLTKQKIAHDKYNLHKLLYSKAKIPDDYFNPKTLATQKVIHSKIEKIINCSNINMGSEDVETETGELKKYSLYNSLCGVYVLCPICSRIRSEVIWSKYGDKVNQLHKKYRYAYSLTFTLDNRENFEEMYALINTSISRFFKKGQKRGIYSRSKGESSKIKAAIGSVEVKTGRNSNKAHVHLHMLAFTDIKINYVTYDQSKKALLKKVYKKRIPKFELDKIANEFIEYGGKKMATSKLRTEWFNATFGNSVNVKCSKIKDSSNIRRALMEAVKYPIKTNEMNEDLFTDILLNRDNKRFLRLYGEMINRGEPDSVPVEDEEKEIVSTSVDVRVYDKETKSYKNGEEKQFDMAHELNGKREEIKEYFSKCALSRCHERELLQPIKSSLVLRPDQTEEQLKEIIKVRDAIYVAWKHYLKTAYSKILKIGNIRFYKKNKTKLTKLEDYYFKSFLANVPIP